MKTSPDVLTQATGLESTNSRIQSVDLLRGAIMVLMAIDHVRVYSGIPAGGPDVAVFFTRWVTHFCAPGFAFLAGTSAFLYGLKVNSTKELAKFLVTRGAILVVLEMTVIRFLWAFNINYSEFILAGVIWMLGWCMILLATMVSLKPGTIGIIGVAIILLQQLFGLVPVAIPGIAKFWEFIYQSWNETYNGVNVLYCLVPWIGVMAAGYGFGEILKMDAERRNRLCLVVGLTCIALWIVLGSIAVKFNDGEDGPPFIFQLLNQSKYPASQLFLMMTLGPIILLVPYAEKVKGWFADVLKVFGKVAFFYYLMHILVIHVSALVVHLIQDGVMHHDWFLYAPYTQIPEEARWSLPLLYLVFAIDVVVLYFVCRWYVRYKAQNASKGWLKYV